MKQPMDRAKMLKEELRSLYQPLTKAATVREAPSYRPADRLCRVKTFRCWMRG